MKKICIKCEKETRTKRALYCSDKCRRDTAYEIQKAKKPIIKRYCRWCNKTFISKKGDNSKRRIFLCSDKCYNAKQKQARDKWLASVRCIAE